MKNQRGAIIVLLVIILVVFMALCGLLIGAGTLSTNKSRAKNISNAAALAALNTWVSLSQNASNSYSFKANAARDRANQIINSNTISGLQDPSAGIGQLELEGVTQGPDSAGTITLGMFYTRDPGSNPCPIGGYPCFIGYGGSQSGDVNAVRVRLRTKSNNPVIAPFVDFFQNNLFRIEGDAMATLVQRCTAFLLDTSLSTIMETHDFTNPGGFWADFPAGPHPAPIPRIIVGDPLVPGLFALRNSEVSSADCSSLSQTPEQIAWCNTRTNRMLTPPLPAPWDGNAIPGNPPNPPFVPNPWPGQNPLTTRAAPPTDCPDGPQCLLYRQFHYRNDYEVESSPFGAVRVDKYVDRYYQGPEPLNTFLLAFNAGLRTLQQQQTAFDKATVKAFTGRVTSQIPPALLSPSPLTGSLTNDLGYLIQITNADNRGTLTYVGTNVCRDASDPADPDCSRTKPKVRPNFIDHGLFPVRPGSNPEDGYTNLIEVLDLTMTQLQDPAACPANAKKQIIIATDGVGSCSYITHDSSGNHLPPGTATSRTCGPPNMYNLYLQSERQLIGELAYDPAFPQPVSGATNYQSILERAIEDEIAITVLLAGSTVEPNFINISDQTPPGGSQPDPFISFTEAQSLGFGSFGFPSGSGCPSGYGSGCDFFEQRSSCPGFSSPNAACDQLAYDNQNKPGYIFRRPNGVLGRLALKTGGLWCPLMPLHPDPTCYQTGPINGELDYTRSACRSTGRQTYALTNTGKSMTAASCASQAVGANPFMLAEPNRYCYLGSGSC